MTTLRLRLRTWLGWGGHPEELRTFGKMRLRFTIYSICYFLLLVVGFEMFTVVMMHGLSAVYMFSMLQRTLPVNLVIALGLFMYFGLPAISNRIIARRATSDVLATTQGRCFDVLLVPPHCLFAHIGLTPEAAIWYLLPLEWDAVVMPSEDTFEVEYLPATGWVHRVRRFGESARELVQPAPSELNNAVQATEEKEENKQASGDEQRELRRYARKVWSLWGEPTASIAACGWTGVLSGMVYAPGMLVFGFWIFATYPKHLHQSDTVAGIVLLTILFAVGCGLIMWGVWSFRLWGRVRRAAQGEVLFIEGAIVSWMPRNQDRETIVKVRADNGETKIVRVRRSFNHRVRRVGGRVRIGYMPVSEYVTDVRYAEAPAPVG